MENNKQTLDEKEFPMWTIEEFDAIEDEHVFSPRYHRALMKVAKAHRRTKHRFLFPVAATAACLMLSVGIYASAAHGEFFQRIFGNALFQNVQAKQVAADNNEGGQYIMTYPKKEYVSVDLEAAEALIGTAVYDGPLSVDVNDHTIIIDSVVRDEQAIVMEFSITCDTGVKAFDQDMQNNSLKGQDWSMDASFFFEVKGASGDIYIDFDRSTETSVHGVYYGLFLTDGPLAAGSEPVLAIGYTNGPRSEQPADAQISYKYVDIPATKALERTPFTSIEGGYLDLSPIGLTVNMEDGLGLANEEIFDPAYLDSVTIAYTDGSVYQVFDREGNLENYATLCSGGTNYLSKLDENGKADEPVITSRNTWLSLAFNRLVDPALIESVTVNGVIYIAE